jgi:hypothetical protein
MGNKEWPDDWKVGNGPACVTLGCLFIPFLGLGLGLMIRWVWPHVERLWGS